MREDISHCVFIDDFDEVGVGVNAVVETVEVDEEYRLCSVVL